MIITCNSKYDPKAGELKLVMKTEFKQIFKIIEVISLVHAGMFNKFHMQ